MEIIITKQFARDVYKELDKQMQLQLVVLIEQLQAAPSLQQVANVKKMKGYKTAFRIKMGEYRIGFILELNQIKLSRVMNRKDIYKYFP